MGNNQQTPPKQPTKQSTLETSTPKLTASPPKQPTQPTKQSTLETSTPKLTASPPKQPTQPTKQSTLETKRTPHHSTTIDTSTKTNSITQPQSSTLPPKRLTILSRDSPTIVKSVWIGVSSSTIINPTLANKWWSHYSIVDENKRHRITKESSLAFLIDFSKAFGKKLDVGQEEQFYEKCATTKGNLTQSQFQVLITHIANHFKIQFENILTPYTPETLNHPRHNHPVRSIRGLDGHICNACTKDIGSVSYRCDECDFDLCQSCSSVQEAEEKKKEVMERLCALKNTLIEVQKQNDLYTIFKIDNQEEITLELLNKQYARLNLNADKEDDVDGTYAMRNNLRDKYWARIERKEELLQIYKKYLTYRQLYSEIDTQAASILCLFYKSVEGIKSELESLLSKENQEPAKHILFQEICAFRACIEALLRFKDPLNPILPRIQREAEFDFDDIFPLILLLKSTPEPFRNLCIDRIMASEDIPVTYKMMVLAFCANMEFE